jgi:hypothetical protein
VQIKQKMCLSINQLNRGSIVMSETTLEAICTNIIRNKIKNYCVRKFRVGVSSLTGQPTYSPN